MSDMPQQAVSLRRLFSPIRGAALAVSLVAVFLILSRLDRAALHIAFKQLKPMWFLVAAGAFALSLSLGAWRWHQMLRITGVAVDLPTSWRLTVVGHTFCALLFGAAVSDVAKATLYSRWFGFPLSRILAASALDRSAGAVSTILYGLITLGIALWAGPPLHWAQLHWTLSWPWVVITGLVAAVIGFGLYFLRRQWVRYWDRFVLELGKALSELRARPALTLSAIVAGLLVQVLVSTVLGCCLCAIHPGPLPWMQLLWTFPVIGVAASMPVTLSGAGARDGAAILLWATFGISSAMAFSACLLTLCVNLGWAFVGIGFAWHGFRQKSPASEQP